MTKPQNENGRWSKPSAEWLEQQHLILGKSVAQIARELNAATPRVRRWLVKARVLKKIRYSDTCDEADAPFVEDNGHSWVPPEPSWLIRHHHENREAVADIAEDTGASVSTVRRWLTDAGLAIQAHPRRYRGG